MKNAAAYIAAGVGSGSFPQNVGDLKSGTPDRFSDALSPDSSAYDDIWRSCLQRCSVAIPPAECETWLRPCTIIDLDHINVVVATPNIFVRQQVQSQYHSALAAAVREVTGRDLQLILVIAAPRVS
ncbi:MAG: hypothetical protein NVS2B7_29110 [Herpetosiphon sp.]